jgi:uncharacterized protein YbjT (DUF2867 family)
MILITGSTGLIGRQLVQCLLDEGKPVRILLSEHKAKRPLPWATSPEVVIGSVLNDEDLFRAVSGVHVVYHLENAQWWGRRRILRSGVVFGVQDAFVNHIAMMMRMNPFFFMMPGQGEVVLHPIFIDDLVKVLVRALDRIDTVDQVIEIGGAEYITLRDLLSTVMRVSGMQRLVLPVPPYVLRWLSGIYSRVLPRALMTPQWLDLLAANRTARIANIHEYFDIQPKRFEDTLITYMPQQRYFRSALRYAVRRRPRES